MKSKDKAYNLLARFVGNWKTEGKIISTQETPEVKISGTDTYEWLPGEFFLLHRVDVFMGDKQNQTLEIIGVDKEKNEFTMQHYDNNGDSGFMTGTCVDDVWIFLAEDLRFTGGFKNDDKEFSGIWEKSTEDKDWTHFMDIKLTKVD